MLNYVKKNIRKLIVLFVLSAISFLGLRSYIINEPLNYSIEALSEINDYILNTRTRKIHSIYCDSVSRMSDKNKKTVQDTLENLRSNDYIICERCNAGLKIKRESLNNILNNIENALFGDPKIILPTREEYLASIDKMGEWYVKHIPTYESNIDENNASVEALNYYKSIKGKLNKVGELVGYPCEYIRDNTGVYDAAYDDCVRYMFSCLNCMNNKYINLLSRYSMTKWSNIDSNKLGVHMMKYNML